MDDKPTVQMDPFSEERKPDSDRGQSPPTIPIDDLFHDASWPPLAEDPTPPPPVAPPPAPDSRPDPAGQTTILRPEARAPLLAWLAVVAGPGGARGQVFTLEPETVIGRKTGQILLASDASVSGNHARVRLEPREGDDEGHAFVLYDLASSNGTFAGDRESYRDERVYRHELKDGDFILLGETTLVFKQVVLGGKS